MNLAGWLLKVSGWRVDVTAQIPDKCLICVAPHTSNWDFIICELAYRSIGRKAGFLMKETWFFFPLGYFFRALGGIPVPRKKSGRSVVNEVVALFDKSKSLQIAITPEGTRSKVEKWRTGFLQIAMQAHVPCMLAAVDFADKKVVLEREFVPTGDIDADMRAVKDYYRHFKGRYPEKFTTD